MPHMAISALLTLSGCSFQASHPAPVESLSFTARPVYSKGSIQGDNYRVKRGDTLYSIAWGADTDFLDLIQFNNLSEPYTIYPGQILRLSTPYIYSKPQNNKEKIIKSASISTAKNKKVVETAANTNGGDNVKTATYSEKNLVNKNPPPYHATSSQQKVNQGNAKPVKQLPKQVNRWVWPVTGRLIDTFSESGQGNKGIKIAGNRGEIIKSAAKGRVVYAGNALRGYGNLVIIKHSDDYLSAYAHADKILVKEKQAVKAGQAVATMGSTDANRVMLHFEIRYHGKSVNPLNYLPKR
ncbi:peptidoglycan DD-metalloendopeptidase family protein [Shewanella sp. NFH-SH190041]|uniref:peptidoglycan DD-metalloendopeptidase family protein n=1 Tax=Shewanella sp. NFH-SH190041 TaxID=2950245 RepID=UPI0021C3D8E4|nr:peptidoglycan DD-metalloendopeptidase family protein [Shewanella sp. NFH-SH190041]